MDILGRRDADDPEEPDAAPRLDAVYDRLRRFANHLREVGSRLSRRGGGATRQAVRSATVDRSASSHDRTPTECPAIAGFPDREYPLTYPARELVGVNSPDVVCIETGEGLRLSMPENEDAALESDVWTKVEP